MRRSDEELYRETKLDIILTTMVGRLPKNRQSKVDATRGRGGVRLSWKK